MGRDAREMIERQIAHMSRMIEDLLDLSRVIAGKINLKLERFDLAELVCRVVAAWRNAGRLSRHAVVVEAQAVWIVADRTRLEQVVTRHPAYTQAYYQLFLAYTRLKQTDKAQRALAEFKRLEALDKQSEQERIADDKLRTQRMLGQTPQ